MKVLSASSPNIIAEAVKVLRAGGLVIYPTETCYGAAVDATSQPAVDKLLRYKARREGRPISIAVTDQIMASKYVKLNTCAINLYKKFLPGPLTVISRGRQKVALGIESETNTLAIRIPDYPLALNLIRQFGRPITATSANVSYQPRPYSIPQLLKYTSKKQQGLIDLIIDAGQLPFRPVSTIVDTTLDDLLTLRQGKIKFSSPQQLITNKPQQTSNLAKTLILKNWRRLQTQPLVFLLIGDLGAGKTQFCKGIGQFLGISQTINSPTFTLENEYDYCRHQVRGKFFHLDTWRLQYPAELKFLNLASKLRPKNIVAIEWADRVYNQIIRAAKTKKALIITISLKTDSESPSTRRQITFGR